MRTQSSRRGLRGQGDGAVDASRRCRVAPPLAATRAGQAEARTARARRPARGRSAGEPPPPPDAPRRAPTRSPPSMRVRSAASEKQIGSPRGQEESRTQESRTRNPTGPLPTGRRSRRDTQRGACGPRRRAPGSRSKAHSSRTAPTEWRSIWRRRAWRIRTASAATRSVSSFQPCTAGGQRTAVAAPGRGRLGAPVE
jgi:hypothetical protein